MAASWVVRKQLEAERGETAATVWLLKLSAGEELGLSRVLAEPCHDELCQQWRDYRDEMTSPARPPSKLESVGPSAIARDPVLRHKPSMIGARICRVHDGSTPSKRARRRHLHALADFGCALRTYPPADQPRLAVRRNSASP